MTRQPRCGARCHLSDPDFIPGAEAPICDNVDDVTACVFCKVELEAELKSGAPKQPSINIRTLPNFTPEQLREFERERVEREEIAALEARIAALEARIAELRARHAEPIAPELPKPLQVPRFDALVETVTDAVERVANGWSFGVDLEEHIFEVAVEAVYGKEIWKWW